MGAKQATREEQAALKRIVALLLVLADLAASAGSRSPLVRGFVLWLLRQAEAVARDFVVGEPDTIYAPMPVGPVGDTETEALRLAISFRLLAWELDREASRLPEVRDGCSATEPPFDNRPALRDGLGAVLVLLVSAGRARPLPHAPDTS